MARGHTVLDIHVLSFYQAPSLQAKADGQHFLSPTSRRKLVTPPLQDQETLL